MSEYRQYFDLKNVFIIIQQGILRKGRNQKIDIDRLRYLTRRRGWGGVLKFLKTLLFYTDFRTHNHIKQYDINLIKWKKISKTSDFLH